MQYGTVRLQIKGYMPEKMINIAAKRGCFFQNIKRVDANTFQGEISVKSFRKLRPVARKARCRMHILDRWGPAFVLAKWLHRKTFFLSGLCSLVLLLLLSNRLATIEINVPAEISKQEVLQCLQEKGIQIGTWTASIDDEALTATLKSKFDEELAWAEVTLTGTTLVVDGAGFTGHPQIIPYTEPCDVVAEKDGVIVAMDVKNGVKNVEAGQTVTAGDLLISGTVKNRYDETDTYQVHAHGTVTAATWYKATQVVTTLDAVRTRTGNSTTANILEILGFSIPLSNTESPYAVYDQLQESRHVLLFGKIRLPITLHRHTWLECEESVVQIDGDTALENAKQQAYAKCLAQIPEAAEVQKINFSYENTQNDGICVVVIVECIESIGVLAPITGG